jgi:hypothetical protein
MPLLSTSSSESNEDISDAESDKRRRRSTIDRNSVLEFGLDFLFAEIPDLL